MIKEFWKKLTNKRRTNKALTRKEQVLAELDRGPGTARQLVRPDGFEVIDCAKQSFAATQKRFDSGH